MPSQIRDPTGDFSASNILTAAPRWSKLNDYPTDNNGTTFIASSSAASSNYYATFSGFNVPEGNRISGLKLRYYWGKNAGGACSSRGSVRVGGSNYVSSTITAQSGWFYQEDVFLSNPATSHGWTVDDINGVGANPLQAFGFSSADSNPAVRYCSLQMECLYYPNPSNINPTSQCTIIG
jgi:hypothetical protein